MPSDIPPVPSSPGGRPAAEAWLLAAALTVAALLLFVVPYLPFQDLPNHALLLTYDRALGPDGNAWLQRPAFVSFGYTAYIWATRLLAPFLSVEAVLKLLAAIAVVALPLATARLASVLGAPAALAGLLVLPFALGWPLRMGLVSFVLGVPLALLAAASAVLLCRRPTAARAAILAFECGAAYLTHAFAFGLALALTGLAAAVCGRRSPRQAGLLVLALLPAAVLAGWDGWHGSWRPTEAASAITAPEHPVRFRPVGEALSHVACRTYGIPRASSLPAYLPHLLLLAAASSAFAVRRRGDAGSAGEPAGSNRQRLAARRFLLIGGAVLTLGTVAMPDSAGRAYLLGSRPAMAGMCLAGIAAAAGLRRSRRMGMPVAAAVTLVACAVSLGGIAREAREVREVVGERPPRTVSGNVLVARAADCRRETGYLWGAWDPLRLVWAYALSPRGSTPYLFAEHRYDMVWYRPGANPPYPPVGRALSDERTLDASACAERNRDRVARSLAWPGYDGVLVTGSPDTVRAAVEGSGARDRIRLGPGLWLLSGPAGPARDPADGPPRTGP